VFLENLVLTHKEKRVVVQNLFEPLQKINQLKGRNNQLFVVSTV